MNLQSVIKEVDLKDEKILINDIQISIENLFE